MEGSELWILFCTWLFPLVIYSGIYSLLPRGLSDYFWSCVLLNSASVSSCARPLSQVWVLKFFPIVYISKQGGNRQLRDATTLLMAEFHKKEQQFLKELTAPFKKDSSEMFYTKS